MDRLSLFILIVCRAANNHVLCSWAKYSWADDMVQVAKKEMWTSEVCFKLLALPGSVDCLLERSYRLQTRTTAVVEPH